MVFDVAVVGGGFAGMSVAPQPARARRRVAVVEGGLRRNRFASSSHGFRAQDGRAPAAIVTDARAQLAAYATVHWFDAAVTTASGRADAVSLQAGKSTHQTRRTIQATDVADALTDIPGLLERWRRTVFHCPNCHGYELQQGRIAAIAASSVSLHQAQWLPEWGGVTFLLNPALSLGQDDARLLAECGVEVEATPVAAIVDDVRDVMVVRRCDTFDGTSTASSTPPASPLAAQLACEHDEGLQRAFIRTDAMEATSVPDVFARGDAARATGDMSTAEGEGDLAGMKAHASLVFHV
jgi:thioredoxin reductase